MNEFIPVQRKGDESLEELIRENNLLREQAIRHEQTIELMRFCELGDHAVHTSMRSFDDIALAKAIVVAIKDQYLNAENVFVAKPGRDYRAVPEIQRSHFSRSAPPVLAVLANDSTEAPKFISLNEPSVAVTAYDRHMITFDRTQGCTVAVPIVNPDVRREPYFIFGLTLNACNDYDEELLTSFAHKIGQTYSYIDDNSRDTLTGLYNRRRFDYRYDALLRETQTTGDDFGLVIVDGNGMKPINDTYGHAAGDVFLEAISKGIRKSLGRHDDICGRTGGDEFSIALPRTSISGVKSFSERLHENICSSVHDASVRHRFLLDAENPAAIGYSTLRHSIEQGSHPAVLREFVDKLMYVNKQEGK